jgi:flagellar protein FliS
MNAVLNSALRQYKQVGVQTGVADASPHRLIQLLMAGALDKIAIAKGNIARGETSEKGRNTSAAIAIVDGLRGSLDMEKGGEIARNLDTLYEYMIRCLMEANFRNETAKLDEVASLMGSLKSAWDAIPEGLRGRPAQAAS